MTVRGAQHPPEEGLHPEVLGEDTSGSVSVDVMGMRGCGSVLQSYLGTSSGLPIPKEQLLSLKTISMLGKKKPKKPKLQQKPLKRSMSGNLIMLSAPKITSAPHSSMPELSGGADEVQRDGAKQGFLQEGG